MTEPLISPTYRFAYFDIEADGLTPKVVHCLVITDADSGIQWRYRSDKPPTVSYATEAPDLASGNVREVIASRTEPVVLPATSKGVTAGVRLLERFKTVVAHNAIGYDVPVLERLEGFVHKSFVPYQEPGVSALFDGGPLVRDSMVLLKMLHGNIREAYDYDALEYAKREDAGRKALSERLGEPLTPLPADILKQRLPGNLAGSHSLEAWGRRVGMFKGDYAKTFKAAGADPWEKVTDAMVDYCASDVDVLQVVWEEQVRSRILGDLQSYTLQCAVRYHRLVNGKRKAVQTCVVDVEFTPDMEKLSDGSVPCGQHLKEAVLAAMSKMELGEAPDGGCDLVSITVTGLPTHSYAAHVLPANVGLMYRRELPYVPFDLPETPTGAPEPKRRAVKRRPVARDSFRLVLLPIAPASDLIITIEHGGSGRRAETADFLSLLGTITLATLPAPPREVLDMEHAIAYHMHNLREDGLCFNLHAARKLEASLRARKAELSAEVAAVFEKSNPVRVEPVKWTRYVFAPQHTDIQKVGWLDVCRQFPEQLACHPRSSVAGARMRQSMREARNVWHREMWGNTRNALTRVKNMDAITPLTASGELHYEYTASDRARHLMWSEDVTAFVPAEEQIAIDPDLRNLPGVIRDGDYTPVKAVVLNPNSRTQLVAYFLDRGWCPAEFTATGIPSLTDAALEGLQERDPVASVLRTLYLVEKRLSSVAGGSEAWIKAATKEHNTGRIHPRIDALGAVTMRATHSNPNISQVPAGQKTLVLGKPVDAWGELGEWGLDCRALFTAGPVDEAGVQSDEWVQVGADLSSLELCCFAHYVSKYDGGQFVSRLRGGEDIHEGNRANMGVANRTQAKRILFAQLYGAGVRKLGEVMLPAASEAEQRNMGSVIKKRLIDGTPGFSALNYAVQQEAGTKVVEALDGRYVHVRSPHAALNTLLQSLGALIAKYWINEFMRAMAELGCTRGWDGQYVLTVWSHDEIQVSVRDITWRDLAGIERPLKEIVRDLAAYSATKAGIDIGLKADIKAEARIGRNWAETH
jgi:DNA polymerase family A